MIVLRVGTIAYSARLRSMTLHCAGATSQLTCRTCATQPALQLMSAQSTVIGAVHRHTISQCCSVNRHSSIRLHSFGQCCSTVLASVFIQYKLL